MSVELFCKSFGKPNAPSLIFLHGLFGNHRNLHAVSKLFESDFNIFIPDMRNHGQSPHHFHFDYDVMSDDLMALMDKYKINNPMLVGHSMGGKIAMLHALKYPKSTSGIFILDIAPINYNFDYIPVIENLLSINLTALSSREDADQQLSRHYNNRSFRQFLLQNLVHSNGQYSWRLNLQAIKTNINSICQFPEKTFAAFTKPSFFLAGEESDYVSPTHHHEIDKLFPNHSIEYVAEAGHWLHADQPEKVGLKLREFLINRIIS